MTNDSPSSFAHALLTAQRDQHVERMAEARELRTAVSKRLDKIESDVGEARADLAAKPGKLEVRAIIGISAAVFVLLLVGLLQLAGVNTAHAVRDTTTLLQPLGRSSAVPFGAEAATPEAK